MGLRSIALAFLALASASAVACDCATLSVDQRVQLSQSVFIAEVVSHAPLNSIELSAIQVFKGRVRRRLTIATAQSDCDFFLPPVQGQPGDRFLVYLTVRKGRLSVSRCLGSKPMNEAGPDLAVLRRMFSK